MDKFLSKDVFKEVVDVKKLVFRPSLEDVQKLVEGILRKHPEYTEYQANIIGQLYVFNPFFIQEYNVKAILNIKDGYGIRLHTKQGKKTVNIDIIYVVGQDLYEVVAHEVDAVKTETKQIAKIEMVFFDQLHEVIRKILRGV